MAGVQSHICKNPEVSQKLEKMYNNKRYSDTIFLVNQQKFHASSHLVSVSSEFLESLLDEHFENCGDREIKIDQIQFEYSFSVILHYMYGLEIDFSQVNKAVLCEVLGLAERYELTNLFKEVKTYFLMLDHFDIDTAVPLVTTAKKYHLGRLCKKLEMFIYQNAEHVVKHQTFNDLPYDIVLQLVKSDFFFVDEIEVLKGVLTWHDSNIISTLPNNLIEPNETNDVSSVPIKVDEEIEIENEDCVDSAAEKSSSNINLNTKSVEDSSEVLNIFSNNVLLNLLSQIRYALISSLDMYKLSHTELYAKYKEFLVDLKYSQSSNRPRTTILFSKMFTMGLLDVTKEYTVHIPYHDTLYESNEEETIGDMKWKICIIEKVNLKHVKLTMKLKCTSVCDWEDWECTVSCQIKLISKFEDNSPHLIGPGENVHTTVILNSENPCQDICDFCVHGDFYNNYEYQEDGKDTLKLEVKFSSIGK